jgi:exosortase/archaeosortase family protein
MDAPGIALPRWRTMIAAGLIALVLPLTPSRDVLAEVSRPLVIEVLQFLGLDAEDRGEAIGVDRLEVPWSRDCDGANLLVLLLALSVWVNRHEPYGRRFWLRLVAMVPAAITANLLRVLTLIGYRAVAYPAVESPQTHYFIGFIWLIPFLALITPRGPRPLVLSLMETSHAAAVVALLAPLAGSPNGTLVSLATVIALSVCRGIADFSGRRLALTLAWMAAGIAIAVWNVESLWLPWLLVCPLLVDEKKMLRFPGLICLTCTHPLMAMQVWSWGLAAAGLILAWFSRGEKSGKPPAVISDWERSTRFLYPVFFACLALPFLASSLLPAPDRIAWTPPVGVRSRELGHEGYEVRVSGQPAAIGLACYTAPGRDRHHTVKVCLKYRGIDLSPAKEDGTVMTEGRHWYREFFLQNGELLSAYSAYLGKTFRPGADPGVHLIFVAPCEGLTPGEFSAACEQVAEELHRLSAGSKPALAEN